MDRDVKKKERESALKTILGDHEMDKFVFGLAPTRSPEHRYTLHLLGVENEDELEDEADVELVMTDGSVGKDPTQLFQFQSTGGGYVALCTAQCEKQKRCVAVEKCGGGGGDAGDDSAATAAAAAAGGDSSDSSTFLKWMLVPFFGGDTENAAQFSVLPIGEEGMFALESRHYPDFVLEAQLDADPMVLKLVPATNASDFAELEIVEPF